MREQLKHMGSTNVFPVLSLVASGYFFYCFSVVVGLPPTQSIDSSSAAYLGLAILFFVLPEVRKFQNTKLRECQADLNEAKNELQDLKSEMRALMSAYNGLIFSVSNATNHLMSLNTLPNSQDVNDAKKSLNTALGEETGHKQMAAEIDQFLNEEDSDFESALWDLRRVLDKELRRVMREEMATANFNGRPRFLSSVSLFDRFLKKYPDYGSMYNAFHFVLRVSDAALHGREVPEKLVKEAFHMGLRILDSLRQLAPEHQHPNKPVADLAQVPLQQPVQVQEPAQMPQPAQAAQMPQAAEAAQAKRAS